MWLIFLQEMFNHFSHVKCWTTDLMLAKMHPICCCVWRIVFKKCIVQCFWNMFYYISTYSITKSVHVLICIFWWHCPFLLSFSLLISIPLFIFFKFFSWFSSHLHQIYVASYSLVTKAEEQPTVNTHIVNEYRTKIDIKL